MDPRMNFDSLLALAKNNYSELNEMQPGLESRDLSDAQLHEIYLTAVKANQQAIDLVPDPRRDEEILIALIMHKENKIDIDQILREYINEKNSTYNILVALVKKEIRLLLYVQNNWEEISKKFNVTEQQTYATLCLDVLKDNWRAMRLYPGILIEDNTVMEAIQKCKIDVAQDWRDIIYVPEYLLEDEFFQPSILKAKQAIISSELEITPFTSQKILTEEGCLAAVARDVYNFSKLPSILRTKNICREVIKESVYRLRDLEKPEDRLGLTPDEYKNLCFEAIEIHGSEALSYIPFNMQTYDLYLDAVNKGVEALRYFNNSSEREGLIANEYKDIFLEAIKIYGAKALQYIPREMRTYELYVAALNNNIDVLQFLKESYDASKLTSSEYADLLKLTSDKYGMEAVLKHIRPEMRTKSLWIAVVTANVSELYKLNESTEKTILTQDDYKDIRVAAIMEHGHSALSRIDPEMWNYELCLAAVNKDVDAFGDITTNQKRTPLNPDEYAAIISMAKDKYGIEKIFRDLPPPMRTYDLCLEAIKKNQYELNRLEKAKDRIGLKPGEYNKLCLEAIGIYGYNALNWIHPEMRTYDICLEALKKDECALLRLKEAEDREGLKPGEYNKLCLEAIEMYGHSALRRIEPEMRIYELCLAAVNKDVYALSIIKERQERPALNPDEYAAIFSVAKDKYGIKATFPHLSAEMRTYDICLEAIKKDEYALRELVKLEDREGLKPGEYNTLCLEALKIYDHSILGRHIPPEMWTYDLCLAAVTHEVSWLEELQRKRYQTKLTRNEYTKIYLEANKVHGSSVLAYYPPEMRTFDIYLDAVNKDVRVLSYLKDPKDRAGLKPGEYSNICLEAIETHGSRALGYIDPDTLTYDLILAAVNKDVGTLSYIHNQNVQEKLTGDEYFALHTVAKDKYGIKATFRYLPPEMKTYDVCLAAANDNVDVLSYLKTANDRKKLTSKEYSDLCLIVIKKQYVGINDPSLTDDILINFIARYESINEFNNYKMDNIGTFFSRNVSLISDIYPLLGKYTFLLMGKMLITSADNLNRFLSELKKGLTGQMLASCSKNISRLFDNIDYKNAVKKASQLKLYLFLSSEEKKEINILLDDSKINIETIPNLMRELLIKRFYDYLSLPFNNKEKNVMDTLSNEQLADLNGLFEELKITPPQITPDQITPDQITPDQITPDQITPDQITPDQITPDQNKNKIFFSMLKVYLGGIPFQNLHQPDEMSKKGDEYMVKMAAHNKKLRAELAVGGIDVSKAFSYKKQIPLTFDEHQKQKILEILDAIYKKIKESIGDKKPDAINKNIKNLITQIEKGQKKDSEDTKLLKILSESNLTLLKKIADSVLPDIKAEYLELTKLAIKCKCDFSLMVINDDKEIREEPLRAAKQKKTPILIQKQGQFKIYGDPKGDGNWKFTEIEDKNGNLSKFPFNNGIINHNDSLFTPDLITTLKKGHALVITPEDLTNYTPRKFHIEMWDKSKIETLFLGDYLSCCLATTGSMRSDYAPRVFDDAFLMPVIIDETTKRPVCGAWLFFGEATKPPSNEKKIDLVANFFEINAGIAENKELMNFLVVNLLNYIGQFSESIHAAEFIMRPLSYGMIPDFHKLGTFSATNNRTIEKVSGYFGKDKYYLNAVGTANFYQFDQTKFGEQMRKLIAPEPKAPAVASEITLGFISKPPSVSETENYPAKKPSL